MSTADEASAVVVTGYAAVHAPALEMLPEAARSRAARSERITQLAFSAVGPALAMAGLATTDGEPRARVGIVVGTAFGCLLTNAAFERRLVQGGAAAASPRLFAATVSNAAAGEVSIVYRMGGPAITLTAGSAAGLVAIGHAIDLLHADQADVLVAGGVDAADTALEEWLAGGGMRSAVPPGEGAAMLVLERATHARARAWPVQTLIHTCRAGFDPDDEAAALAAPSGFAAAGPMAVLAAMARLVPRAQETVTLACPSGHRASVVVERVA